MQCFVYRSRRKADTYVYLGERDGFAALPAPLREALGALTLAVEFELTPERKLAREDPAAVLANLRERGYHLQWPPPPAEPARG